MLINGRESGWKNLLVENKCKKGPKGKIYAGKEGECEEN